MFGYVRAYKPEMKMKDYEAYRGIYCSVCRALGRGYRLLARLTLSYDITMLAVLHIALTPGFPCFKAGRCPFNLAKRCNYCVNRDEQLDFSAAVSVLLVYHKLRDNLRDDGFFGKIGAALMLPYMSLAARKAAKRYPETSSLIAEMMVKQTEVEEKNAASPDEAAEPMAKVLSSVFAYGAEEKQKRVLERFGYCIGRWVYIIDAAQDIEKDIKKHSYNVFVTESAIGANDTEKIIEARKRARASLNICCAEAIKAYELCDIYSFNAVLSNILYDGLNSSMNDALSGEKKEEEDRSDDIQ